MPLFVREIFQDLIYSIWIVVGGPLNTTRIHHLLMIFHKHGRRTTDSKLFHTRVHLENVLICQSIRVHHILRFNDFEHMLLDIG